MHGIALFKRNPGAISLLILLTITIVWALLAVWGLTGCSRSESATTGQANTGQTTSIETATAQTVTASQTEKKDKFSKEDLLIDSISYGATPDEIEQNFSEPLEKETSMDQVTGNDRLIYTYEGLQLVFTKDRVTDGLFHLKSVEATIQGYRFAHGLQVGDSFENVINSFAREENDRTYQGFTVLYGDPDLLDSENATGEIAFGYYDASQAFFLAMTPPYMSENATVYDEMAILSFSYENQTVTSIRWMLGPGAE